MEKATTIEELIAKSEVYAKTTLKLCKYEAIYKMADIFSNLAVKLVVAIVVVLASLLLTIGLSLYVGHCLGEPYWGFLVVAFVQLGFALLLYIGRNKWIKVPVSNYIIRKMQKKNDE